MEERFVKTVLDFLKRRGNGKLTTDRRHIKNIDSRSSFPLFRYFFLDMIEGDYPNVARCR